MSHPLVQIDFVFRDKDGDEELIRHWYHVPRVGDRMSLVFEPSPETRTPMEGLVKEVIWMEEQEVEVIVQQDAGMQ